MKKLVIIGIVFPEPNSTAAGKRMLQLIDFFQTQNYQITFLSSATESDFSTDLTSLKIQIQNVALNDSSFDEIIKDLNPDTVLFDRFVTEEQFGWRVAENCPDALRILDTEDLHFLRKAREKAHKERRKATDNDCISDTFKREIASILRCDLSLIISEFEMNLLTDQFKIAKEILHYLPIFVEEISAGKPFQERKNFVSIGNFLHEPNWQTVLKLRSLWPEIREKIPDAELHIYGAYVSEKARQLHNEKEKFLIKGRTDSVQQVFESSRVLLAPIPFGAGIKGKLLESMQFGLPNITTNIGAEGMKGNLDWNGFITDEDESFVEKSAELYSNESIWTQAQENGFEIIRSRFKSENFLTALAERLHKIQENLTDHRDANFLGQILQFHTLQSTKYMSRWIEEKNRRKP